MIFVEDIRLDVEKIYFDMDSVLADFERGVRELCGMTPPSQNGAKDARAQLVFYEVTVKVMHDNVLPLFSTIKV